jgi:hypothetical protein
MSGGGNSHQRKVGKKGRKHWQPESQSRFFRSWKERHLQVRLYHPRTHAALCEINCGVSSAAQSFGER